MRGDRHRLERQGAGWWRLERPLAHGTDYSIWLDGEGPFPDPRSRWQPRGIEPPSRILDPARFVWTDHGWRGFDLFRSVIYELHVGTFTAEGTYAATRAKLDHLVELGVDAVELMPANTFPGRRGWGYDGVGLWAPHEGYGGPGELARLVDECHARGLAVILDVVYNHLGPAGNHLARFGPYFTDRYKTPWGDAVNLDGEGSDEVRSFFIENALMWLQDYHLDGLRLDAVHALLDRSATHLLEELQERTAELSRRLGRPLWLIAESDLNDPRILRSPERGGYGLAAQWSDDFHHALHAVLTGERTGYYGDFGAMEQLATAWSEGWVYRGQHSAHRQRRHGRAAPELSLGRLLGYAQTHDQVGNRAAGERLAHLVSPGRAKIAAALVLLGPFLPLLFMGEEWAASSPFLYFTDHPDPELAEAVRRGRRAEFASFGWAEDAVPDPQDPATFERSRLSWSERDAEPHAAMLAWYKELIRLRRELQREPGERRSAAIPLPDGGLIATHGEITIAVNLSAQPLTLPLTGRLRLASDPSVAAGAQALTLPPDAVAVLVRDP